MPVWWSTFLYMLVVSGIGTIMYKRKKEQVTSYGTLSDSFIDDYKSIGLFFALASFVLLTFFAGQRSYIFDSTDYQYAYTNYYSTDLNQIRDIWNGTIAGKGKLYMTILVLFKHFSGDADFNAWFTFVAMIQCLSIALFLYKYSVNFVFSIYLYFTSSCFLWLVNGFRQFLAVALILFFVDWIKERKTIPFIIVVILAYHIHSSSILWLPVYFLINIKPWSKKFILLSFLFTVVLLAFSTSSFLDDTEFSYVNTEAFSIGVNPFRVVFMSIPAIFAFWKRKEIENKTSQFIQTWINISVITTECYVVGMFTSGVVGRIAVYFQVFNYLLLPWLLRNAFNEDERKVVSVLCVIIFIVYFYYDMYIAGNGIYNSTSLNLVYYMV